MPARLGVSSARFVAALLGRCFARQING